MTRLKISILCASLAAAPGAWAQTTTPAPQADAQSAVQAPPKPPVPNRFNRVTPKWLTVRGEFRDRMEGGDNIGFTSGRDDVYWLNRFRFDVAVKPSRMLSVFVQGQDARVTAKDVGPTTAPFRDTFDLKQLYAEIGDSRNGRVIVKAGRQELFFGEQRLVGHLTWVNGGRSFDGVRLTVKAAKGFKVDAFATSVVRVQDGEFDRSGNGNRFIGAYGSATSFIPKATFEPYVLWKRDQNLKAERGDVGDLSLTTIGERWVGKLPAALDYGAEMAYQAGTQGTDDVRAFGGHWIVGRTFGGPWKIRVAEEYNFASGDANPADGKRTTFDQLYPTGHDKMGLADQVGWRNIHDVREIVEFMPRRGWPVTASVHSWWLADAHDGLYNAAGALVTRVATGAAGSRVGDEVDVQLTRAITPQVQLAGGIAHVFPGPFLKATTPGAAYTYPFAMVTYVFLADK